MNIAGIVALSVTIPLLLIAVVAIVYMAIVYRFRHKRHEASHKRMDAVAATFLARHPNIQATINATRGKDNNKSITQHKIAYNKREIIKDNLEKQYDKFGSLPMFVGTAQPPNVAPDYAPSAEALRVLKALANY